MLVTFNNTALRQARNAKGLSQAALAEMVDCEPRYLGALERGEKRNPAFILVAQLCLVLDIPMETLVKILPKEQTA